MHIIALDSTIRFERKPSQADEVNKEKQEIYEPCLPFLSSKYNILSISGSSKVRVDAFSTSHHESSAMCFSSAAISTNVGLLQATLVLTDLNLIEKAREVRFVTSFTRAECVPRAGCAVLWCAVQSCFATHAASRRSGPLLATWSLRPVKVRSIDTEATNDRAVKGLNS
ncbi:hypothetical protein ANN_13482 [Periplaneta americana]|uniref:Uncharacterized protein n=1 Tax=Periplaneta americana TaxID=6978 RepID=A0ABQ8TJJ2_PERAM|nr:hypothetical protein ANN_13482 [Periplaneta americana]